MNQRDTPPPGRAVHVEQGDLAESACDVLVNASNTNCDLGSGVSGAIARTCGGASYQEHLHAELERVHGGPMRPGQVLITDAGSHPEASWVAHVAVMDYRDGFTGGSFPDVELIKGACANLWDAIGQLEAPAPLSVAMPALGAGTGQLGVRAPTEAACDTLQAHWRERPDSAVGAVRFFGFTQIEYLNMAELLDRRFALEDALPEEVQAFVESLRETT